LKKYTPIEGVTSTSYATGNGESRTRNNRTAGIDTNHSTVFTLLLELNVICEQRWIHFKVQNSPSRVFAFDGKIYITI